MAHALVLSILYYFEGNFEFQKFPKKQDYQNMNCMVQYRADLVSQVLARVSELYRVAVCLPRAKMSIKSFADKLCSSFE